MIYLMGYILFYMIEIISEGLPETVIAAYGNRFNTCRTPFSQ